MEKIPIKDSKDLKEGDIIIYGKGTELGLSGYTKDKEYEVIGFSKISHDVIVINDKGCKCEICSDNIIDYFELLIEESDSINHPPHYTWLKEKCGIEVIDITRHMDFCLGNAIKYILRAGHKKDASLSDNQKEIEDLKKAVWYINDRIKQLGGKV